MDRLNDKDMPFLLISGWVFDAWHLVINTDDATSDGDTQAGPKAKMAISGKVSFYALVTYGLRGLGVGNLGTIQGRGRLVGLVLGFTSGLSDDKPPTDLLPTRWIMVWYRARPEDTIYERVAILELKLKRPLEAYDLEEDLFYTFEEVKIG